MLKRTVARLAAADAPQLFTALVERLRGTPARAASLLPWLRAALTQHASVLAAAPPSRGAMSLLSQLAEQRTALLGLMLALRGRLDVLVAAAQPLEVAAAPGEIVQPFQPVVRPPLKCCMWGQGLGTTLSLDSRSSHHLCSVQRPVVAHQHYFTQLSACTEIEISLWFPTVPDLEWQASCNTMSLRHRNRQSSMQLPATFNISHAQHLMQPTRKSSSACGPTCHLDIRVAAL